MRAIAIIAPGMFLSQPPTHRTPSISWPFTAVSIASAITSRETSEYFMPSVPMPMPSVTVGKPNTWGIAPAAFTAATARSTRGWMPALQGFMVEWPFATPTIALSKSPSPKPTARNIARLGERASPDVIVLLLQLSLISRELRCGKSDYRLGFHFTRTPASSHVLVHPNFDPVAIQLGPLAVRWYGLMYLVGFGLAFWLGRLRIRRAQAGGVTQALLDDLLFFGVLGVVLGGRLGYVLFYKPDYYFLHPLEIPAVWHGGMSFHGGFLGVLLAVWWIARKHRLRWLEITDFLAPLAPLAFAAGRLGNFINGELPGRVTTVPWGMVFQGAGPLPRHPSQIYQFALEGVLLFVILWIYSAKPRPLGAVSGVFLIGYGALRFAVEFFREPDDFLGLLALDLSMGQWLSAPMIVVGVALLVWAWRRPQKV